MLKKLPFAFIHFNQQKVKLQFNYTPIYPIFFTAIFI